MFTAVTGYRAAATKGEHATGKKKLRQKEQSTSSRERKSSLEIETETKRLQSEISADELEKQLGERDTEIAKLKRDHKKIQDSKDAEYEQLLTTLQDLDTIKQGLENEKSRLEIDIKDISAELQNVQNSYDSLLLKYDKDMQKCQGEINTIKKENQEVTKDNHVLRAYIDSLSTAQELIHGDDLYTRRFNDLKNDISSWVAKRSKRHSNLHPSPAVYSQLLDKVKGLGDHGKHTEQFIRRIIHELYTGKETRIPFLRNIIALFLFEQVFNPFAFGLECDLSNYLKYLEKQLFIQC